MTKLSPAYREDTLDGLPVDVKEYLDKHFLEQLDNLQKSLPKILVVFSGGSAVGKSTLASHIKQEFGALVLENDAIKTHLIELKPDIDGDELNTFTWKYSMDLYGRLDEVTSNGLIVRDGVIDWYFDRILPIFEKAGYLIFIIAYDLSLQKRKDLIKKRGDKQTVSTDRLMTILQDQDIHMERFRKMYTPNVTLHDTDLFSYDRVLERLQSFIDRHNQ